MKELKLGRTLLNCSGKGCLSSTGCTVDNDDFAEMAER
jgi:hypothetical protein